MSLIQIVEFNTPVGYKTVELHHTSIEKFEKPCDLLILSAYTQSNYAPSPQSVIGALKHKLNIDVSELANQPELDFRKQMSIWLSKQLLTNKFNRIVCLEGMKPKNSKGKRFNNVEISIINLFSFLSILDFHKIKISSIIMPVLGTGVQGIDFKLVVPVLMEYARKAMETNLNLRTIYLVERSSKKIKELQENVHTYLVKEHFNLSKIEKTKANEILINQLVVNLKLLQQNNDFFKTDNTTLVIIDRLTQFDIRVSEFAILSRRFIELLICEIIGKETYNKMNSLWQQIKALNDQNISWWVINYFHTVRNIGNDASHSKVTKTDHYPARIDENDVQVLIVTLNNIVQFYDRYCKAKS